jgi:cytoskeletal protein CcmA (bactofilin family)
MRSGQALSSWPPAEGDGGRHGWRWWRLLVGYIAAVRSTLVVHDRRLGERRRERLGLARERRRGERRGTLRQELDAVASHLGAGSKWQGELHFRGVLRIDGTVEGPRVCGGALIIGELGRVRAAIDVDFLQVHGQVQGEIHAWQRVELRGASRVTGTILAPRVEIWPGAFFHGPLDLGHPASDVEGERTGRRAVGDRTR